MILQEVLIPVPLVEQQRLFVQSFYLLFFLSLNQMGFSEPYQSETAQLTKCKIQDVNSSIGLLQKGLCMASLDLKGGYYGLYQ